MCFIILSLSLFLVWGLRLGASRSLRFKEEVSGGSLSLSDDVGVIILKALFFTRQLGIYREASARNVYFFPSVIYRIFLSVNALLCNKRA